MLNGDDDCAPLSIWNGSSLLLMLNGDHDSAPPSTPHEHDCAPRSTPHEHDCAPHSTPHEHDSAPHSTPHEHDCASPSICDGSLPSLKLTPHQHHHRVSPPSLQSRHHGESD